jgi:hypothetical protein
MLEEALNYQPKSGETLDDRESYRETENGNNLTLDSQRR